MKTLQLTNYIKGLLGLLVLSLWSCQDDWEANRIPEGEPATLHLQISLSDMQQLTRANMSAELENRVNNLWVGVYNVATGKRTGTAFIENAGQDFPESKTGKITLSAQSGESYIVAVANCVNAEGFKVGNTDGTPTPSNLKALLDDADTWDAYRAIALCRNYEKTPYAIIDAPTNSVENGLVMQGSYRSNLSIPNHSHQDDEPEKVGILPDMNNLNGVIHLRRLWSQNTINIEAAEDVISMEIIEMEVVNVPQYTWLQSRNEGTPADTNHRLEFANAGDAVTPTLPDTPESHPNYLKSLKITQSSIDMTTGTGGGTKYSYSFWQYENKRTGHINTEGETDPDKNYAKRETEHKTDTKNSGIYTALCPNGTLTLNNNATYLRFKAVITYKTNTQLTPEEIKNDPDADFSAIAQRTAEATYVVHLGYIGQDANDFNCYRNAKYTYNIQVQSVNKILVEAWKSDELQPGAEGEVNDVTEKFYPLDCHYNVFNIYLTRTELDAFTFTLRTYEDNVAHDIKYLKKDGKVLEDNVPEKDDTRWKYYSWIQLVRNDNITDATSTVIASFPRLNSDGTPQIANQLYYLKDIAETGSKLITNNKAGQGFTVYIKEYTYEADYGEKDYGNEANNNWTKYVNQPDRTAHFNVSFKESSDKESIYYKSKYALAQKSIQTYYDVTKATGESGKNSTALGIEHENEVFGMNIRWPKAVSGLSSDNGRYNTYLGYKDNNSWSNVLDLYQLQHINKIDNTNQTKNAYHISTQEHTNSVPKTVEITSKLEGSEGTYNGPASETSSDPQNQTPQFIHALNACMNRNKDENGDGKIDNAELKWYVPASGKYLRIILGRNSLKTPLMNYEQKTLAGGCGSDANTLYHFIASDDKIIWVDEGASSSIFTKGGNWAHAPWQVRCIRNLGTNLQTIEDKEKVIPAYDATDINSTTHGGVVKVNRYHGSALREPQTAPLPMHKSDDPYNRIARYGFEIAPRGNEFKQTSYDKEETPQINNKHIQPNESKGTSYKDYSNAVKNGDFCKSLNENSGRKGWRLPNQKEIVIMMRMEILSTTFQASPGATINAFATCTQEHWTNYGSSPGNSTEEVSWNYRLLSLDLGAKIATAVGNDQHLRGLRCVRDLTAAEASMPYSEIVSYKQP